MGRIVALSCVALALASAPPDPPAVREDAYRANNRGVALLEQYKADEAVKAFREALAMDPKNTLASVNLAIAFLNVPDTAAAEQAAKAALEIAPDSPQAWYVRGVAARAENRTEDARAAFRKVLAVDSSDVGAHVNLGQLALLARDYETAITEFRAATAAEPYNGSALYNLGIALVRSGKQDEGQKVLDKFQTLKSEGAATMIGQTYPEQGRYAEAVVSTGNEPDLVDPATPDVRFVDATKEVGLGDWTPRLGSGHGIGSPLLFDWNNDGALDLLVTVLEASIEEKKTAPGALPHLAGRAGRTGMVGLFENKDGRFEDVTSRSGLPPSLGATGSLSADIDNDVDADLLTLGPTSRLFRREAAGFVDATEAAGLALPQGIGTAAFADLDHDGDVDLVVASTYAETGTSRILRNDGTGRFSDVTAASLGPSPVTGVTVAPTDFDNRRDMDLLLTARRAGDKHSTRMVLFKNMRDGSFKDVADEVGFDALTPAWVTVGDVNKDGYTDFLAEGVDDTATLALSDGRGGFTRRPGPRGGPGVGQVQLADYDNDGLLDVLSSDRQLLVFRNTGSSFVDVTAQASPAGRGPGFFSSGDIDADGDVDIVQVVTLTPSVQVLRNQGGNANRSLKVDLQGLHSNGSGIGAKVEVRAGSLHQKIETSSTFPPVRPADVIFGLGQRVEADAVRVIWPSGTMQAETPPPKATTIKLVELDRKPSSCPYLYAWNGERFEFITDFMGGGEMGYRLPNGALNTPDPVEYVRLTDEQLKARHDRFELRVTNELEELLFVDSVRLGVIDHPAAVEVHPNEGMVSTPAPHRLLAVVGARVPRTAIDEKGRDVADLIARVDDRSPSSFGLARLRGYAAKHALTLDLSGGAADVLLLTGWTDYAFSSDNVAAGQAGMVMHPPSLQMRDETGSWQTVMPEIGIPVGRPQTIALDLTGRWLSESREVRIVTNMRIYWDQIRVGGAANGSRLGPRWLDPVVADLKDRGFSAELTQTPPRRTTLDYARISAESPWKVFPGRYTRLGDVRRLLAETDDVFVLSKPGDELALSFDANAFPPPRPGFRRTFLLYSDGYSKEMDINSATPDSSTPWPFHAMTRYPYGPAERFPMTPQRQRLYDEYNTRVVRREIGPLLTATKP